MRSPLWFSWRELPLLARFFILVLVSVSVYVVLSASIVFRRAHSLMHGPQSEDAFTHKRSMLARCSNMGQLIRTTFYLFGFVFFLMLPGATWILGDSKTPVGTLILQNFIKDFAFAADVFFVSYCCPSSNGLFVLGSTNAQVE
jgi:hypothetical protein